MLNPGKIIDVIKDDVMGQHPGDVVDGLLAAAATLMEMTSDFQVEDFQERAGEIWRAFNEARKGPDPAKKVCPSGNPQLEQHNWGLWRSFDPMIAGSEIVLWFSYSSDCQNLGCEVRRFAKNVTPHGKAVGIVRRHDNGNIAEILPEDGP